MEAKLLFVQSSATFSDMDRFDYSIPYVPSNPDTVGRYSVCVLRGRKSITCYMADCYDDAFNVMMNLRQRYPYFRYTINKTLFHGL